MADKDFGPKTVENEKGSHTTFTKLCKGCGICIEKCPVKCISWDNEVTGVYNGPTIKVDIDKCIHCGLCETCCPDSAIKVDKN